MGNGPQDEIPHLLKRVRPLADHQLDRPRVEGQQCLERSGTNGRGLLCLVIRGSRYSGGGVRTPRTRYYAKIVFEKISKKTRIAEVKLQATTKHQCVRNKTDTVSVG